MANFKLDMLFHVRDIPMPLVTSGVEHGNLRELALARMKDLGTEVGNVICTSLCEYTPVCYVVVSDW